MVTYLERAVHSVNHMFSLLYLIVVFVVSHLGFECGNLVLIAPVLGHCLPFTFKRSGRRSNLTFQYWLTSWRCCRCEFFKTVVIASLRPGTLTSLVVPEHALSAGRKILLMSEIW